MKPKIMYIENKSEGHSGSAWIGYAEFSKSGQTVYFDNKALKKLKTTGISGNHFDIETGEEYWVSGIKKNGQDRHWAGGGKVMLDKDCVEEYLKFTNVENVDEKKYIVVEVEKTDKSRFNEIENLELENEELERLAWDRKKNVTLNKATSHNSNFAK
ncbi:MULTISPECIES: hypothetical protein [Flavobacterium]|uniref:Uncharacterized protein n=1 Tax=Flavobacterium keumense TaxID=1306518 RepID=A0ABY8N6P5_9FLAO|nr:MULTISPECIES: hypothetical protein [Flavobacterium]WGK95318.1 hypothetical protein MG292_03550 [Flavobacterium keumense]